MPSDDEVEAATPEKNPTEVSLICQAKPKSRASFGVLVSNVFRPMLPKKRQFLPMTGLKKENIILLLKVWD